MLYDGQPTGFGKAALILDGMKRTAVCKPIRAVAMWSSVVILSCAQATWYVWKSR